jgi:hypothetical protein
MSDEITGSTRAPVRDVVHTPRAQPGPLSRSVARAAVSPRCEDCRATTAFHAWHDVELPPSFNMFVSFADYGIPPAGKRAVIELVTAQLIVPAGESARLRMYTSLGSLPSNIDLFLTSQGNVSGQAIYVATHSIRAYSDGPIEFDINRDNDVTTGHALICISGYLPDA